MKNLNNNNLGMINSEMLEDSHVIPLAPARFHVRSDEEAAATVLKPQKGLQYNNNKKQKSSKCFVYMLILGVLLSIGMLVFGLTMLSFKSPRLRLGLVEIQSLQYAVTPNSASLNVSLVAELTVDNMNFGPFKFHNGTTSFTYGNSTLGVANIGGDRVGARSDKKLNVTVVVRSEGLRNINANFSSDVDSGLVGLHSYGKLRGVVRTLNRFRSRRSAVMNCNMILNLRSQQVQELRCT